MPRARMGISVAVLVLGMASLTQGSGLASAHPPSTSPLAVQVANDEIFPGGFEQMFTLSIDNFLAWCDVSVNGDPPTSAPPPSAFEQGRVIPLHGDPADANYFVWGFWTGTDGGDHDTNMDTTVTMSADLIVHVCCPDIGLDTCQ